jgi:hypothetical protein
MGSGRRKYVELTEAGRIFSIVLKSNTDKDKSSGRGIL